LDVAVPIETTRFLYYGRKKKSGVPHFYRKDEATSPRKKSIEQQIQRGERTDGEEHVSFANRRGVSFQKSTSRHRNQYSQGEIVAFVALNVVSSPLLRGE